MRLIEIGEAVKGISPDLLDTEPDIPWKAIARMRDHLTHRYFDTDHSIVADVVENELGLLLNQQVLGNPFGNPGAIWARIWQYVPDAVLHLTW